MSQSTIRFPLGTVTVAPGAAAALEAANLDPSTLLARHQAGDWSDDDREGNEWAVRYGHDIASMYPLPDGAELLVITVFDRSCTCVLLESEYEDREVGMLEGYDKWARTYDIEKNPLIAIEEPRVQQLLDGLPFRTALDVGTGTGRHALRLARRGVRVTAIDQSPEMLDVARNAATAEKLDIEFHLSPIDEGLPFQDAEFDLVVSALMLCHMPDHRPTVRECGRVLRPGGHLLITDFHPDAVARGWRTTFWAPGAAYLLPSYAHGRAGYLDAVAEAGLDVLSVEDLPVREIPKEYGPPGLLRDFADANFGLVLLARKPE